MFTVKVIMDPQPMPIMIVAFDLAFCSSNMQKMEWNVYLQIGYIAYFCTLEVKIYFDEFLKV